MSYFNLMVSLNFKVYLKVWPGPGACSYNCNATHHHPPPANFLSKWPSINSLIKRCVLAREVILWYFMWYSIVQYSWLMYSTVQYSMAGYCTVQYCSHFQETIFQFFIFKFPGTLSKKETKVQYLKSLYHALMHCTKDVMGVRGQKVPMLSEFKSCKGCQRIEGTKGAWVKSSQGLLGGRVFSRTHFRSILTPPEEGSYCFLCFVPYSFIIFI